MGKKLLIVFGLPGAGKSFVAQVLLDHYGYTVHNGDDDLPEVMKSALLEKGQITDSMRQAFLDCMIRSLKIHLNTSNFVVLHQTLLKEFMRQALYSEFPFAQFILVTSEESVRETRYANREYFNLGIPYLRHMSALFDPPIIPHKVLRNTKDGQEDILQQLTRIIPNNL